MIRLMIIDESINAIFQIAPVILIKIMVIVLLLLHLAFSFVIMRQTQLMTKIVEAKISSVIYTISIIHLLASLFVLFWAILFF